jgi:hypothetical protein
MPTNTEIQAQIAQLEANIVALTIQLNPAAEAPKPPGLIYSDATSYSVYTRRNGKTAQMSVIERVSLPTAREEATALHRRYKTPVRFIPWDCDHSDLPDDCALLVEQRFLRRAGETFNGSSPVHVCEKENPHTLSRKLINEIEGEI